MSAPTSAAATDLLLAYYADDFTGSTDALESLAGAGLRTFLFTEFPTPAQLAAIGPLDAVGFAGAARSLAPTAMESELRPAFTAIRALGAAHVHYKVCSTFDSSPTVGSIGRAIDIGAEVFASRFVPLVVGAPTLGRYCIFGNLFARMGIGSAGEIHRLDRHPSMSRHPTTPADEADLRLHLAKQTKKSIALLDFLKLDLAESDSRIALENLLKTSPDIVLFDALTPAHLTRIGALLEAHTTPGRSLFSAGSSGIESALGAHWAAQKTFVPKTSWPAPGPATPLLVISGSCSPVTARQITWAEHNGFTAVTLDAAAVVRQSPAAFENAIRDVTASLRTGRHTILLTSRGETDASLSALPAAERGVLGAALGSIARQILADIPLKRLLIAGGDSSSYAACTLGIQALEMIAPLAPGAPLCRAHAPNSPADNLEVNFKGGQVGDTDYFAAVASGHL